MPALDSASFVGISKDRVHREVPPRARPVLGSSKYSVPPEPSLLQRTLFGKIVNVRSRLDTVDGT